MKFRGATVDIGTFPSKTPAGLCAGNQLSLLVDWLPGGVSSNPAVVIGFPTLRKYPFRPCSSGSEALRPFRVQIVFARNKMPRWFLAPKRRMGLIRCVRWGLFTESYSVGLQRSRRSYFSSLAYCYPLLIEIVNWIAPLVIGHGARSCTSIHIQVALAGGHKAYTL